jgi:putative ABC transport system permease protein
VVGLVASLAFTRVLGSLLFEVQPNDPGVLVGVSVLVLLVSGVATLIPARRALRIDPVIVMRTE